jgi:hypothetical protein
MLIQFLNGQQYRENRSLLVFKEEKELVRPTAFR